MRSALRCLGVLFLLAVAAPRLEAQRADSTANALAGAQHPSVSAGRAFIASAALPGAGQYLLERDRWIPYLAVEAYALLMYRDRRARGRTLEKNYRDLAWDVARRVRIGERRDTVFAYYEALGHWEASGAFDSNPTADGIQPETDVLTFNGEVWRLARGFYAPGGQGVGTPEYAAALAYYQRQAIPPGYLWAWGASELEQRQYASLIKEGDEAFRAATRFLGVILANHVVSAVDALVTARGPLERNGLEFRLESGLEHAPDGARYAAALRLYW